MDDMKHLSYELCKELKEAGFPQLMSSLQPFYEEVCGEVKVCYEGRQYQAYGDDFEDNYIENTEYCMYKIPSLSELIEACGKLFIALEAEHLIQCTVWVAKGYLEEDGRIIDYAGDTPEEAVAKLWLELNKKV